MFLAVKTLPETYIRKNTENPNALTESCYDYYITF